MVQPQDKLAVTRYFISNHAEYSGEEKRSSCPMPFLTDALEEIKDKKILETFADVMNKYAQSSFKG